MQSAARPRIKCPRRPSSTRWSYTLIYLKRIRGHSWPSARLATRICATSKSIDKSMLAVKKLHRRLPQPRSPTKQPPAKAVMTRNRRWVRENRMQRRQRLTPIPLPRCLGCPTDSRRSAGLRRKYSSTSLNSASLQSELSTRRSTRQL